MRCLGRKKTTGFRRRCTNEADWWMPFCWRHRYQLLLILAVLIIAALGMAKLVWFAAHDFGRKGASSPVVLGAMGKTGVAHQDEGPVPLALPQARPALTKSCFLSEIPQRYPKRPVFMSLFLSVIFARLDSVKPLLRSFCRCSPLRPISVRQSQILCHMEVNPC